MLPVCGGTGLAIQNTMYHSVAGVPDLIGASPYALDYDSSPTETGACSGSKVCGVMASAIPSARQAAPMVYR
jgi:hypothetical protein